MRKALALVLAVVMLVALTGCSRFARAVGNALEDYRYGREYRRGNNHGYTMPEPMPIPEPYTEPDPVAPKPLPEAVYSFGEDAFLEYAEEEKDIPYEGNMFNDIYNYGEPLSLDEIDRLDLSQRSKEGIGGELFDFLEWYCVGEDPFIEARAVTVNGVEEPFRCLYVRLHYPDKYFDDDSYSDIYDEDYELFLVNCNEALLQNGYDTVMFSMHGEGELKVLTINTQENGTFLYEYE